MLSIEFAFRLVGMFVFGYLGWLVGGNFADYATNTGFRFGIIIALVAGALGLLLTPFLTTRPFVRIRAILRHASGSDLIAGLIGAVIGLVASALLTFPLSLLPEPYSRILPLIATALLSYGGAAILIMRKRDLYGLFSGRTRGAPESSSGDAVAPIIVDTSAIIDGRIADISRTGFLRGDLIIPRFVLHELQHIADSSDSLRRNRGRRGLDILNRIQKEAVVPVSVPDIEVDAEGTVDAKLVKVARDLHAVIVTNDYNLNRVAELQGIKVLNINDLANAVKPVVLPGEEMVVRIIQEGKELGQGVGYLDDGTMVVVESGKNYLNTDIDIVVTRVLQTTAGRMIFAQPRPASH